METNGVAQAISKYADKQRFKPKRRNEKPEEAVVKEHLDWYSGCGFFMQRYESKAKKIGGVWRSAGATYGTPDLGGVCALGYAHWNEIKAPGRRSTIRDKQRDFLREVIYRGGFGACSDSVVYTSDLYTKWRLMSVREKKIQFLLDALP